MTLAGLPLDEREMIVDLLHKLREKMMTPEKIRELDEKEEFPIDIIKELLGPNIGLQLLFIPEEYDGLGGGARDIARVSEEMAKICLGLSTAFLAIHLGTDPILVGATPAQKKKWLGKIADGDTLVAYAVTEPDAGSNLSRFKTTADPVKNADGEIVEYILNGTKQFISNGGYADLLTVLAQTPEGPSFFVVEKGMKGFSPGKAEVKHGIRCSNTSPLIFENVRVPFDNLVGKIPGQGLIQANEVFGYTRLMVAAFGLGAGVSVLEKAIAYSKQRIQFGSTLIEKQGYTHKLLVPNFVRLEAARAYIEEIAVRLDSGEHDLQVEGSIAKFFTTEAANKTADDAIQALGGYGYITEYDVEKIKRDVKITTIYEGTSEIQQMIIGTFRWRKSVRSKYQYYGDIADELTQIHDEMPDISADVVSQLTRSLNVMIQAVHKAKLTRQQHIMFELSDVMTYAEVGTALVRKAFKISGVKSSKKDLLKAVSRVFAAMSMEQTYAKLNRIIYGSGKWSQEESKELSDTLDLNCGTSQTGVIQDMNKIVTDL